MERGRPTHGPDIIVADVGDLMGQDAGDLVARHAAQQPLGQYDRGAFRTAQRVGVHIARSREAIDVRQSRQAGSAAYVRQDTEAQTAFHENRERLRKERLVRAATEGPMLAPTPELPDDTPIERVLFSTRIQNALRAADLKTVGEVRENETLISLPDFGKGSLSDLRKKLGLPSTDGVR